VGVGDQAESAGERGALHGGHYGLAHPSVEGKELFVDARAGGCVSGGGVFQVHARAKYFAFGVEQDGAHLRIGVGGHEGVDNSAAEFEIQCVALFHTSERQTLNTPLACASQSHGN
jgi:hypothetical protein